MQSRLSRILFMVFAPITVPAYLLFLGYVNLAGICFFLLVEQTIAPLLRRKPGISPTLFWAFSPVVIAVAAPLLVVHMLVWTVRAIIATFAHIGRWQGGLRQPVVAAVAGGIWAGLFVWSTAMCIDGSLGMRLIGRQVPGRVEFSRSVAKRLRLGELPSDMQARRAELVKFFRTMPGRDPEGKDPLIDLLNDNSAEFSFLHEPLQTYIAGIPWYFVPSEISTDGTAHCYFQLGLLLLVIILMVRWPGAHRLLRRPALRAADFVLRVGITAWMVRWILTWRTTDLRIPLETVDAAWFRCVSPAAWFGREPMQYFMPEWIPLNAALWLMLVGVVVLFAWIASRVMRVAGVPRYYSAFLAARLLQRKRIAFFSVGAVTLCVAMLLIVASVMGGFVETIRARANGLLGDIVMDGDLRGFPYYSEFIKSMKQWPEVAEATALIHCYGTLRFVDAGDTFPVRVWGVKLDEYCGVNSFCKDLYYNQHYPGTTVLTPIQQPMFGYDPKTEAAVLPEPYESAFRQWLAAQAPDVQERWARAPGSYFRGPGMYAAAKNPDIGPELVGKPYPGIIVGRDIIARRLANGEYRRPERFPRGCATILTILPLDRSGKVSTEPPPSPVFRYVDDSRTGIYEIDSRNCYVAFDVLQEKLAMGPLPRADGTGETAARCSQIQIKFRPGVDWRAMKPRIDQAWDEFLMSMNPDAEDFKMMRAVRVSTWEEMQADYIGAIQKEKVLVVIMFSVISLVAVFLVLCIFYMIVIEKTRDIGIIKSVGGSAEGVAAVFLTYGAAIGIVGSTLGSIIGYVFVRHINDIQDWLARLNPNWRVWSPETYSFDKIPDVVETRDIIMIGVAAVLASIVGAVVPAIRAARIWPVEALRYE